MINTIFFVITTILLSIFDISNIAVKGNVAKNYILNFPVSIVKRNLITSISINQKLSCFINVDSFERDSLEYFNFTSLQKNKFKINYTYFNYDENSQVTLITNDKPQNVQIHVICNYYKDFVINEYLSFITTAL